MSAPATTTGLPAGSPVRPRPRRRRGGTLLLVILGTMILLYPVVATVWNDYRFERIAQKYAEDVEAIEPVTEVERYLDQARQYNAQAALVGHPPRRDEEGDPDFERYMGILNPPETQGVMARISIPSIGVELPVYHTVRSEVLYKGAGHMHGSDFPVGGLGTNAVISAHTGMVDATMFDNLPKLQDGEDVFITVLNQELRYRVTGRQTVKPEDYSAVTYEPNKDKITLITCTPYGINSDRLLVVAERIPLDTHPLIVDKVGRTLAWWMIVDLAVIVVVWLIVLWQEWRVRRRRAAQQAAAEEEGAAPGVAPVQPM